MKKVFLLFFTMYTLIIFASSAIASCYTGFACSINDLEEKQTQQNHEFINAINDYFDKKPNADLFFSKADNSLAYNDLFIFSTIV